MQGETTESDESVDQLLDDQQKLFEDYDKMEKRILKNDNLRTNLRRNRLQEEDNDVEKQREEHQQMENEPREEQHGKAKNSRMPNQNDTSHIFFKWVRKVYKYRDFFLQNFFLLFRK